MPRRGHFAVVKQIRTAQKLEYKLIALNKGKHMPDSAQQDFLKDLEPEAKVDVFDTPLAPEPEKAQEDDKGDEEAENRKERRLRARLDAERESSIALAAKVEVLTSALQAKSETEPSEYLKKIERLYGTDSPEAQAATQLLSEALTGVEERAVQRAVEVLRQEQLQAQESVRNEEKALSSMVEDIEDTYNVTIDPQTEKGFFQLLEKLSPKDRDGNVTAYADPHEVWEELQARKTQPSTRAKDLASRSMVKTGASPDSSVQDDAALRFLKDNGII